MRTSVILEIYHNDLVEDKTLVSNKLHVAAHLPTSFDGY